jgi:hypothetical protein
MRKNDRLQIRVSEEQSKFLRDYSKRNDITISQMMRDFINWLIRKEQSRDDGAQREA